MQAFYLSCQRVHVELLRALAIGLHLFRNRLHNPQPGEHVGTATGSLPVTVSGYDEGRYIN
jgi:hypothetical protein